MVPAAPRCQSTSGTTIDTRARAPACRRQVAGTPTCAARPCARPRPSSRCSLDTGGPDLRLMMQSPGIMPSHSTPNYRINLRWSIDGRPTSPTCPFGVSACARSRGAPAPTAPNPVTGRVTAGHVDFPEMSLRLRASLGCASSNWALGDCSETTLDLAPPPCTKPPDSARARPAPPTESRTFRDRRSRLTPVREADQGSSPDGTLFGAPHCWAAAPSRNCRSTTRQGECSARSGRASLVSRPRQDRSGVQHASGRGDRLFPACGRAMAGAATGAVQRNSI